MGNIIFVAAKQRVRIVDLGATNPTLKSAWRACSEVAVIRSKSGIVA
ncbi:MAG: hypothetical protein ACYDAH_12060 [Steroidobacteraceae bacterium]